MVFPRVGHPQRRAVRPDALRVAIAVAVDNDLTRHHGRISVGPIVQVRPLVDDDLVVPSCAGRILPDPEMAGVAPDACYMVVAGDKRKARNVGHVGHRIGKDLFETPVCDEHGCAVGPDTGRAQILRCIQAVEVIRWPVLPARAAVAKDVAVQIGVTVCHPYKVVVAPDVPGVAVSGGQRRRQQIEAHTGRVVVLDVDDKALDDEAVVLLWSANGVGNVDGMVERVTLLGRAHRDRLGRVPVVSAKSQGQRRNRQISAGVGLDRNRHEVGGRRIQDGVVGEGITFSQGPVHKRLEGDTGGPIHSATNLDQEGLKVGGPAAVLIAESAVANHPSGVRVSVSVMRALIFRGRVGKIKFTGGHCVRDEPHLEEVARAGVEAALGWRGKGVKAVVTERIGELQHADDFARPAVCVPGGHLHCHPGSENG